MTSSSRGNPSGELMESEGVESINESTEMPKILRLWARVIGVEPAKILQETRGENRKS